MKLLIIFLTVIIVFSSLKHNDTKLCDSYMLIRNYKNGKLVFQYTKNGYFNHWGSLTNYRYHEDGKKPIEFQADSIVVTLMQP